MLGIIGGTGLGEALFGMNFREEHAIDTPFGAPSSLIRTLSWAGLDVADLNRHGEGHVIPPSSVPYRANIFALKKLGVTHLLVSGAVGSLREEIRPRDLVIVDQTIDRTYRRVPTFFDEGMAVHVELANPTAQPCASVSWQRHPGPTRRPRTCASKALPSRASPSLMKPSYVRVGPFLGGSVRCFVDDILVDSAVMPAP